MTVFITWPFLATGATTTRTMPDRLSDVVNVKDWGASAAASAATNTAAIQAALNYLMTAPKAGGKLFFPAGIYACNALTVGSAIDAPVMMVGCGKDNTRLNATVSSFVISAGVAAFDNISSIEALSVTNNSTDPAGGGIKLTGSGSLLVDLHVNGFVAIDASAATSATLLGIKVEPTGGNTIASQATPKGPTPGSVGIYLGNYCSAINCKLQGNAEIAYAMSGTGASVQSSNTEVVLTAVKVGWNPAGEAEAIGCSVRNLQTERCNTGIDLYFATGCLISGNALTGADGTTGHAGIAGITWSTGTATVTTTEAHNLTGTLPIQLILPFTNATNFLVPGQTETGLITATVASSTTFTYPLVANPGSYTPASGVLTWNIPLSWGIRCRKVTDTAILGNNLSGQFVFGSVDLNYDGAATGHKNNTLYGMQGKNGYILPSSANAAGWRFESVGLSTASIQYIWPGSAAHPSVAAEHPHGFMNFADLPGGGTSTQDGPFVGQEFDITDGQKAGGGAAAFADEVAGGSTGNYKVRWNGTIWALVGK